MYQYTVNIRWLGITNVIPVYTNRYTINLNMLCNEFIERNSDLQGGQPAILITTMTKKICMIEVTIQMQCNKTY